MVLMSLDSHPAILESAGVKGLNVTGRGISVSTVPLLLQHSVAEKLCFTCPMEPMAPMVCDIYITLVLYATFHLVFNIASHSGCYSNEWGL